MSKTLLDVRLKIKTVSELNSKEHWTEKSKRHRFQRYVVESTLHQKTFDTQLPITIYLTRYAPRKLDQHDNLPASFKWIVDAICEYIIPGKAKGRADDSDQISIVYDQIISKTYEVRIRVEKSPGFPGVTTKSP